MKYSTFVLGARINIHIFLTLIELSYTNIWADPVSRLYFD